MALKILECFHAVLQQSKQDRLHVRVNGGGSRHFFTASNCAQFSSNQSIQTTEHAGIIDYEPSELVVTVRSGTRVSELEAVLAEKGQHLAFEPPVFSPNATVGGMLASSWSGSARASAGSVRDHVLGMQFINGSGELLQFGGTVMKNVAGYDISRLMVGSFGTLGLITQASIKVLPIPAMQTTVQMQLSQADALAHLHHWISQALPVNASTWLEGTLHLRLSGAGKAVEAAIKKITQEMTSLGSGAVALDELGAQAFWLGCLNQTLVFFTTAPSEQHALWRLSVPQTTAPIAYSHGLTSECVEWHGAQRWLWALPSAAAQIHQLAAAAGGHACMFRPPALCDLPAAELNALRWPQLKPVIARLNARIKAELDPAGVFPHAYFTMA